MIRNADGEHALQRGNVGVHAAIVDAVVGHAEHDQRAEAAAALVRRGVDRVAHRVVGRRRRARVTPTVRDDGSALFDRPAKRGGGTEVRRAHHADRQDRAAGANAGHANSVVAARRDDACDGRAVQVGRRARLGAFDGRIYGEVASGPADVRREIGMIELHAVIEHCDDDVGRSKGQRPRRDCSHVGTHPAAALPRILERPLLGEQRVVRHVPAAQLHRPKHFLHGVVDMTGSGQRGCEPACVER